MTSVPAEGAASARLLAAVAVGGALGALARWSVGEMVPDGRGFPWTTFAVNVVGTLLLALLPAVEAVRRRQVLAVGLGPGVLGGFTTLSAWSEQTRWLLADGQLALAASYAAGTVLACVAVVLLVDLRVGAPDRAEFAAEGGDE